MRSSQNDDSSKMNFEIFDDKNYPSVKIGNQIWMKENLNLDRFRNGDPIPEVRSYPEWKETGFLQKPAWCYFDNMLAYRRVYGKLYNWHAVNDTRELAPKGWHIPSDTEWTQLTNYLGGEEKAGGKLKSIYLWKNPNSEATNESGFSGLPGGIRSYSENFVGMEIYSGWWSSSKNDIFALYRLLYYKDGSLVRRKEIKDFGLYVRCIRD